MLEKKLFTVVGLGSSTLKNSKQMELGVEGAQL